MSKHTTNMTEQRAPPADEERRLVQEAAPESRGDHHQRARGDPSTGGRAPPDGPELPPHLWANTSLAVLYDPVVLSLGRDIFDHLIERAGPRDYYVASQPEIASALGIVDRTVRKWTGILEKRGYIRRLRTAEHSTKYKYFILARPDPDRGQAGSTEDPGLARAERAFRSDGNGDSGPRARASGSGSPEQRIGSTHTSSPPAPARAWTCEPEGGIEAALHELREPGTLKPCTEDEHADIALFAEWVLPEDLPLIEEVRERKRSWSWVFAKSVCDRVATDRKNGRDPWSDPINPEIAWRRSMEGTDERPDRSPTDDAADPRPAAEAEFDDEVFWNLIILLQQHRRGRAGRARRPLAIGSPPEAEDRTLRSWASYLRMEDVHHVDEQLGGRRDEALLAQLLYEAAVARWSGVEPRRGSVAPGERVLEPELAATAAP